MPRKSKKILVVEDEVSMAASLKLCLKYLGYNVLKVASSAEDAVESSEKNNPDVILMDIKLRGENDGYEAATEIRKSFSVPVIYLTGGDPSQIDEKAKSTKPYDYIIKPFDFKGLDDKIKKLL